MVDQICFMLHIYKYTYILMTITYNKLYIMTVYSIIRIIFLKEWIVSFREKKTIYFQIPKVKISISC